MSAFDTGAFAATLGWSAGAVLVVLAVTLGCALRTGRHSVVDTAWGLLFAAVAVVVFVRSSGHGDDVRRGLLLVLPVVWGLRLALHIGRRSRGRPEDPRYERLLARARGNRTAYAVRVVYLLQGGLAFVIAAPISVGGFEAGAVGPLAAVGVLLWAVGLGFEAISDAQLERFRRDPGNRGQLIRSGLWRYTRHPNYFGDACVWWGIFLVAADAWPGVLTVLAPVLMTLLLTRGSGARIMDEHLRGRPGWADYVARTSSFVPWPPRRSGSARPSHHQS